MRKVPVAAFAFAVLTGAVASAAQNSREDLVTACQKETNSGYALAYRMEPSLKDTVVSHRKKLSAECAAFVTGQANSTAALSNCLHRASMGPVQIQRDHTSDRAHVARVRAICRPPGDRTKAGAKLPAP